MSKSKNSYYYNEGTYTNFAFVFSCPGQNEEKQGKPISGNTGKNLEEVLKYLEIDFNCRYDFRISNASKIINYKEKNNRSESTLNEILTLENIVRLKNELENISDYIIFFGEKAQSISIYLTDLKAKFIYAPHLSFQSINQLKIDFISDKNNEKTNTENRLKHISSYIKKQM